MSWDDLLNRITRDSDMMVGQACIRGMRITVQFILETLAAGTSREELLRELPVLEPDDIDAALAYGSELASIARGCGDLVERITCNPGILVGKPCVQGTRISVEQLLSDMSGGATEDDLLQTFPEVTQEDWRAALRLAALVCD